ncbi:MAG TPA: SDR family oxidoreductase [Rubrobacteraceae bacterium]|nr:SDR family oxidoreductase [Rubrobacteraceae bacterium]
MSEISGKTIVITGGASGMGRLLALKTARLGGTVVVYDVDSGALDAVVEEIKAQTGRDAYGFVCDVSDREEVYRTADKVHESVGKVDILINNAGIVSGRRLMDLSDEKIEAVIGVNVLALYWVTKSFLPGMLEWGSGHVVTVASAAGLLGVDKQTDYSASKHAAIGFTESLRVELKKTGYPNIRTTIVEPFYVDTGMFEGVKTRFPRILPILKQDEVTDRIVKAIQKNRQELKMPFIVNLVPAFRLLPVDVFDRLADFFGINASMDEFVGRDKRADISNR